jgi:hypothetical protein
MQVVRHLVDTGRTLALNADVIADILTADACYATVEGLPGSGHGLDWHSGRKHSEICLHYWRTSPILPIILLFPQTSQLSSPPPATASITWTIERTWFVKFMAGLIGD